MTQLLLQSGASLTKTNGIGKTAAQLAGFVGICTTCSVRFGRRNAIDF